LGDLAKWALAIVKVGTIYTPAGTGMTNLEIVPNDPAVIEKLNHDAVFSTRRWAAISTP
jgi:hypothetical protein